MKNIEALIDDGGEITLGAIGGIDCAATAADPASQVFTQAGVKAPEVVTLDVPWLAH